MFLKVTYISDDTLSVVKSFSLDPDMTVCSAIDAMASRLHIARKPTLGLFQSIPGAEPLIPFRTLREENIFSGTSLVLRELTGSEVPSYLGVGNFAQTQTVNLNKVHLMDSRSNSISSIVSVHFDQEDDILSQVPLTSLSVRISLADPPSKVLDLVISKLRLKHQQKVPQDIWALFAFSPDNMHPWELLTEDRFPLDIIMNSHGEDANSPSTGSTLWMRRATVDLDKFNNALQIASGVKAYVAIHQARFSKMPPFQLPLMAFPYDEDYISNHAVWLSSVATLVYSSDDVCAQVVQRMWEMPKYRFFYEPSTDTQALAFANENFVVVAFRGTDSIEDWKTNLTATKVSLHDEEKPSRIKVHKGFQAAFLSVRNTIEEWVYIHGGKLQNPDKPFYITGHSLGGALAVLFFTYLTLCTSSFSLPAGPTPKISVNGVYTFGQPRVGNRFLGRTLKTHAGCVLQRVVNSIDIVPLVGRGTHFGQLIYFNAMGKMIREPSFMSKGSRLSKLFRGKLGIAAHWCPAYQRLVVKYEQLLQNRVATEGGAICQVLLTVHSAALSKTKSGRTPNPYCVIRFSGKPNQQTPVVPNSTAPRWNHTVHDPEYSQANPIFIDVYDSPSNEFLGEVRLLLESGVSRYKNVLPLEPRFGVKDDQNISGLLCVSLNLTRVSIVQNQGPRAFITVHRFVPSTEGFNAKTRLRIKYGEGYCLFSPAMQSTNYEFSFDIFSVTTFQPLHIEVLGAGKKSSSIGVAVIDFDESFNDAENVPLELYPEKESQVEIEGTIIASFRFENHIPFPAKRSASIVTIHHCRDLVAADSNGLSDPYVVLKQISAKNEVLATFQTEKILKTLNPTFDASFAIPELEAGQTLEFEVWDHDIIGKDDFLGKVRLHFIQLEELISETFTLYSSSFRDIVSGTINLSIAFSQ